MVADLLAGVTCAMVLDLEDEKLMNCFDGRRVECLDSYLSAMRCGPERVRDRFLLLFHLSTRRAEHYRG